MALISKPVNLSLTWASGGDVLDPGTTKYATGWSVEIPPRQWFNYLDNRQDTAIAHLNQMGISMWDATTEYQWTALGAKSLVMGSNGTIYRALTTNTNQNPTTTVGTHWEIAFANAGDFYTKTQSDANYLAKAQNLLDLPNTATARTNLSVYSKAETYTKTEVDGKTTVASTLQTQQQTSNTVLLTPSGLSTALKGGNQSLSTTGYQSLPGGLIIQWGTATAGANNTEGPSNTFPVAFPTSLVSLQALHGLTSAAAVRLSVGSSSLTGFTLRTDNTIATGCTYLAIGF